MKRNSEGLPVEMVDRTSAMGGSFGERIPTKILAVDDDSKALEILEVCLSQPDFELVTATSGEEALNRVVEVSPDLIFLDLMMPGMSGHEVLLELKSHKETSEIPVVILTSVGETEERQKALREGADDFLTKPIDQRELLVRARTLLKVRHLHHDLERTLEYLYELEAARTTDEPSHDFMSAPASGSLSPKVLVVEDEFLERAIYSDLLRQHGYKVIPATTGSQALELLRDETVDVILVDLVLPGMSGLELIERLRAVTPETPVIVVTAHPSSTNAITALKLGAFDYIVKGFKNEVMLHAIKRAVEKRQLELQNQSLLRQIKTMAERLIDRQG
ncbi:MAG: response regulator [Candidatus Methylomirabilales bacterium]